MGVQHALGRFYSSSLLPLACRVREAKRQRRRATKGSAGTHLVSRLGGLVADLVVLGLLVVRLRVRARRVRCRSQVVVMGRARSVDVWPTRGRSAGSKLTFLSSSSISFHLAPSSLPRSPAGGGAHSQRSFNTATLPGTRD